MGKKNIIITDYKKRKLKKIMNLIKSSYSNFNKKIFGGLRFKSTLKSKSTKTLFKSISKSFKTSKKNEYSCINLTCIKESNSTSSNMMFERFTEKAIKVVML